MPLLEALTGVSPRVISFLIQPGTSSASPKAAATTRSALETPLVAKAAVLSSNLRLFSAFRDERALSCDELSSSFRHSRTLHPKNAVRLVRIEGAEVASQRRVTRHSAHLHIQTAPAVMLAAEGPVSTMPQ